MSKKKDPNAPEFDLLIKNVRVVRPHGNVVHDADIAISDGRFALVAPGIAATRANLPSRIAMSDSCTTLPCGRTTRTFWIRRS